MKLAYRIPAITFLLLLATAIVNVVAFQYFSQRYFSTYIGELSGTGDTSPDPARIQALLQIGKLNQKDQKSD
jgi:ABC-type Zn uptake system ZnuABC Zn-binding protein ZnuA